MVVWKDNKAVYVGTNHHSPEEVFTVKRWCRVAKAEMAVNQPGCIKYYNQSMGGVDLVDQMVSCYRSKIRKKKWWWCFWPWSINVMMVNSWRLYMLVKNKKMPFLDFNRQVVMEIMKTHGEGRKQCRPTIKICGAAKETVRFDKRDHWPILTQIKGVCGQCKNRCCIVLCSTILYCTIQV